MEWQYPLENPMRNKLASQGSGAVGALASL